MGLYQSTYLVFPLSLLAAHAAGQLAILLGPYQSLALHPHGDHGAMLGRGITPQLAAVCVAHLHPAMITAAGHGVEIDPAPGGAAVAHRVIVIHEAALAIPEPIMHAAPQIVFVIGYPGHEIFTGMRGVLMWPLMSVGATPTLVRCVCVITSWQVRQVPSLLAWPLGPVPPWASWRSSR